MKRFPFFFRQLALLLALLLALAACGGAAAGAATMKLAKTDGTVDVSDADGVKVPTAENLGLYSGYQVATQAKSYAWIDLDSAKRTKLDAQSAVCVRQEGRALELQMLSGNLFFNITEPLADDETLEIRASSMIVGIRGTCGWVEVQDAQQMCVYLLNGKVECTNGTDTALVATGEAARITPDGAIEVFAFSESDVPAFVRAETAGEDGALTPPAPGSAAPGGEAAAHDVFWLRDHPGYTALVQYSAEGELQGRLECTYDESGLLLRAGTEEFCTEYLYDAQNQLTGYRGVQGGQVTAEWYVAENTAARRTYKTPVNDVQYIYELFDETGRQTRRESYMEGVGLRTYSEYFYDDRGRLAQVDSYFVPADGGEEYLDYYVIYEYN